jgi:NIMA (never in mitosis gene a)-related kinase
MEKYEKIHILGRGNSGLAWLVKRKSDHQYFVLKEIEIEILEDDERTKALNEIKILSNVSHPNIIKMHENFRTNDKLCIVMDYCEGGDLATVVKVMKDHPFSENQILNWFVQLCWAVKHLHERNILHRDIKTQNIFLTKQRRVVKLGDFGIARTLDTSDPFASSSVGSFFVDNFFFFILILSSLLFIP